MERDELLPLVHQCWQPLKLLFQSNNIFIVAKAFQLLHVFARCAKEFIHRRTLTDVFPPIVSYLDKLNHMVKDREMHQTMIARQSRSLYRQMIEGLWEFMALLELSELDVDPIIDQMINFVDHSKTSKNENLELNSSHVQYVNEEVLTYFDPTRSIESDILWLKLNSRRKAN